MQSDHLHALSNQLPRKTTRKDGGVNHLRNRQGQLTDINKESSAFKSRAVKSSISLEIHKKDGDMVKPLPPPLVRPFCLHAFIQYKAIGFLLLSSCIKEQSIWFSFVGFIYQIQSIWLSFAGFIYQMQSTWLSFARFIYQIQIIWLLISFRSSENNVNAKMA